MAKVRPYRWLAEYYDTLFTFHVPWFDAARRKILASVLPQVRSACDLACGTGTTALVLASRGIELTGIDLSPVMCRIAREKASRAGIEVQIVQGDMRDFRLREPVDLVTCEFDALNHVPEKRDLSRVASAVARALRPGGWFYFDVNNRVAFRELWPLAFYNEKPGVVAVMHGGYDRSRPDHAWSDIEWFVREGKCWRRHREHFEQVCWSASEIRSALRLAGFSGIRAYDAAPMFGETIIKPGYRTFYLARKKSRA